MNEDNNPVAAPNFTNEPMKMPENVDAPQIENNTSGSSIVNAPLLITLTILLIVIFGGMFYWYQTISNTPAVVPAPVIERPTPEENNEPESTTAEAQTDSFLVTSPSDELTAIESDVNVDISTIDTELGIIDNEMEAELQ